MANSRVLWPTGYLNSHPVPADTDSPFPEADEIRQLRHEVGYLKSVASCKLLPTEFYKFVTSEEYPPDIPNAPVRQPSGRIQKYLAKRWLR